MESALAIANYYIQKGVDTRKPVSMIKIQRLVYFAHAWCWAKFDEPLIDECVEARSYGAIIPSVFDAFVMHGENPIKHLKTDYYGNVFQIKDSAMIPHLDKVWEIYCDYTLRQLWRLAHHDGTPWSDTIELYKKRGLQLPLGKDIDDQLIRDYYYERLTKSENEEESSAA